MSKIVTVKLEKAGNRVGPFNISDNYGNVLGTGVTKQQLIDGVSYTVSDAVTVIILESIGKCKTTKMLSITSLSFRQIAEIQFTPQNTASLWRHLTDTTLYNSYYGNIEPYVIEYPFAYEYHDEILQNVKDFSTVFKYLPIPDGVYNDNAKIQTDNQYFNKAIIYNGQQCSGVLELVPKPMNNLKAYMQYPIYNQYSKTITYTKSDNFYQYNNFWSVVKDKSLPLFVTGCESLSIDKIINQANMDYGVRSFKKDTIRAKGLLIRHILDNRSDAHIISQFIIAPAQISYK
jgi:hypothetical protein